jgi:DNA repair ATPase RecN
MAVTPLQLNSLITEARKARQALDKVLDYADLISKYAKDLPDEVGKLESGIRDCASEIERQIEEIRYHIYTVLNSMSVDPDEVKNAADKLLLYQGDVSQIIEWVEEQKRGHEENSYWWRYWQAVSEVLRKRK